MESPPRTAGGAAPGAPFQASKSFHGAGKRRDRPSRWDESFKKMKNGGSGSGFQRGRGGKFRGQHHQRQHQSHSPQQNFAPQQQQQHQQQQQNFDSSARVDESGELNHLGMLVVNQIVMLDGSIRSYYSLPPDYPMPPDFHLIFPPEFAPVEGVWTPSPPPPPPAAGAGVGFHPGAVIVDAGYQPQFVTAPRQDEMGSSHPNHRKRSHWNRRKN